MGCGNVRILSWIILQMYKEKNHHTIPNRCSFANFFCNKNTKKMNHHKIEKKCICSKFISQTSLKAHSLTSYIAGKAWNTEKRSDTQKVGKGHWSWPYLSMHFLLFPMLFLSLLFYIQLNSFSLHMWDNVYSTYIPVSGLFYYNDTNSIHFLSNEKILLFAGKCYCYVCHIFFCYYFIHAI